MYGFEFHRPDSLEEAARLYQELDDATYLAGGMTLVPTLKQRLASPSDVIDLSAIPDLKAIRAGEGVLEIGAMATHAAVAESDVVRYHIPALAGLAAQIGDPSVRNSGTIGGSLANSDPAADYPAAVLGLGATIVTTKRDIAADDYFLDLFETALEEGEIITGLRFPVPDGAAYSKFSNPASRYAVVGVFVARFADDVRVGVTGAGPCAFRQADMEAALRDDFSAAAIETVAVDASDLNEDIHASAAYRAHLVGVMAARAVDAARSA